MNLEGFEYSSSEDVRDEDLGEGVEFVAGLSNDLSSVKTSVPDSVVQGLQRIADVPINFADPMARRSPSLQQTADAVAPTARMCEETLIRFGISDNAQVRIKQGNAETEMTARLDDGVPAGCIRVAAAHITTAMLGDMFGSISVERA